MVSAISFGWFVDFEKTLTMPLFKGRPNRSILSKPRRRRQRGRR